MLGHINICVIGNKNVGKRTLISAITVNDQIIPFDFLAMHDKVSVKFSSTNVMPNEELKININTNTNIYIYMIDISEITEKQYNFDLITGLYNEIKTVAHKQLYVVVNKCDNFDFTNLESNTSEEYKAFVEFKNQLMTTLNIQPYPIVAKKMFIGRYLYNSNESPTTEIELEIQSKIRSLVGDIVFKKHKMNLITLKEKQAILAQQLDFDEIYSNDMDESGYTSFVNAINYFVDTYYNDLRDNYVVQQLAELSNCTDIIYISTQLISLITSTTGEDESDINYDKIYGFVETNYYNYVKNMLKDTSKINIDIIDMIEKVHAATTTMWNLELLDDILSEMDLIRIDKIVDHFKNTFDTSVLEEISAQLTPTIISETLNKVGNTDTVTFDKVMEAINILSKLITNEDIFANLFVFASNCIHSEIVKTYLVAPLPTASYYKFMIVQHLKNTVNVLNCKEYNFNVQRITALNNMLNIVTSNNTNAINIVTATTTKLKVTDMRNHVFNLDKAVFKNKTINAALVKRFTDAHVTLNDAKITIEEAFRTGQLQQTYMMLSNETKNSSHSSAISNATTELNDSTINLTQKKRGRKPKTEIMYVAANEIGSSTVEVVLQAPPKSRSKKAATAVTV